MTKSKGEKQRVKHVLILSLILVIVIATASFIISYPAINSSTEPSPVYVGVAFGGNTTAEAKLLIDRVKNYTNLFVVQSGPVSKNETSLNEIVDYAVAAGKDVIVYFGWFDPRYPWRVSWLDMAKQRWGSRFLGLYLNDEQGGIQIDANWTGYFSQIKAQDRPTYQDHAPAIDAYINGSLPHDDDDAAQVFRTYLETRIGLEELKTRSIAAFSSDYVLYWFDYLGGYDVMLAQLGWNQTTSQEIALIRGAARMQNKPWGAIITWKYSEPPYLDTGEEIYKQMKLAYEAGAKYVVIFNYPQIGDNPYGIMMDEHFQALEKFWNDVVKVPNLRTISDVNKAEAALVLPRNYGWGMRNPEDRIWYWGPDERSPQIWNISRKLLVQYGIRLDIVYDDPTFPVTDKYSRIYYWNQTI